MAKQQELIVMVHALGVQTIVLKFLLLVIHQRLNVNVVGRIASWI
jgi:hypothetical protein